MMTEDLTSLFLPQVTSQTLCSDYCNTCICKKIKYICTVHNFFELDDVSKKPVSRLISLSLTYMALPNIVNLVCYTTK